MSLKLLTAAIGVARLLVSSRKMIKEARETVKHGRAGDSMPDHEAARLISIEHRVLELEARLEEAQISIRKLTTALYALGAVAAAALALAIIKLA